MNRLSDFTPGLKVSIRGGIVGQSIYGKPVKAERATEGRVFAIERQKVAVESPLYHDFVLYNPSDLKIIRQKAKTDYKGGAKD